MNSDEGVSVVNYTQLWTAFHTLERRVTISSSEGRQPNSHAKQIETHRRARIYSFSLIRRRESVQTRNEPLEQYSPAKEKGNKTAK